MQPRLEPVDYDPFGDDPNDKSFANRWNVQGNGGNPLVTHTVGGGMFAQPVNEAMRNLLVQNFTPQAPEPAPIREDAPGAFTRLNYSVSPGVSGFNRLFGTGDEPRFETWVEKMLTAGPKLIEGAMTGKRPLESATGMAGTAPPGSYDVAYEPNRLFKALGMTTVSPGPGSESPTAQAFDAAGLGGGSLLAAPKGAATLGSGAVRRGASEVKALEPPAVEARQLSDGSWVMSGTDKPVVGLQALKPGEAAKPFYSAVENAVRDVKQEAMTPEQWRGYLSNRPGVKAEELDWIGMPEGKKVTKQQMLDHIKEHGVQVKEIRKKGANEDDLVSDDRHDAAVDHLREQFEQKYPEVVNLSRAARERRFERFGESEEGAAIYDEFINNQFTRNGEATKFSEYQLPGGDNYREVLFTLPEKTSNRFTATYSIKGPDGKWNAAAPVKFKTQAEVDQFLEAVKGSGNIAGVKVNKISERDPNANYQSSHWDEPNVLAHVRVNDRLLDRKLPDTTGWTAEPVSQGGYEGFWRVKDKDGNPVHASRAETAEAAIKEAAQTDEVQQGLKTLHLEEIQSDWHQAGRKQGYKEEVTTQQREAARNKATEAYKNLSEALQREEDTSGVRLTAQKMNALINKIDEARNYDEVLAAVPSIYSTPEMIQAALAHNEAAHGVRTLMRKQGGVPDAPFKTTWPDLVLKRMIREASENGYDAISWTPGIDQVKRYPNALRKVVSSFEWSPMAEAGVRHLRAKSKEGGQDLTFIIDKDGKVTDSSVSDAMGKPLKNVVGNEMAELIMDKPEGEIAGKDFVVGGTKLKDFYDKDLVFKANAIAKKFGGKVEQRELPGAGEYYQKGANGRVWYRAEPDGTRVEGPMYTIRKNTPDEFGVYEAGPDGTPKGYKQGFKTEAEAEAFIQSQATPQKIHVLRLPPGLRDTAMRKGFPLFSAGIPFPLQPVDHDPFGDDKR